MPPNVLLFITDQQRWDTLGYTGRSPCRTPNFDRLARQGAAMDRCLTPGPLCSPARASLFTGRYPHSAGMTNNVGARPALARPTILEVFRDAGYHVAYSGKWHLGRGRGAAAIPDFDGERDAFERWARGHNVGDAWPYGKGEFAFHMPGSDQWISSPRAAPLEGSSEATYDAWIAAQALDALERRPRDRPFFHVCAFWGPHPIFVIPEPYYSLYNPRDVRQPANFADPMHGKPLFQGRSIWHGAAHAFGTSWEPWRRSMAVYWGYVTWLDELIGRVLNRLESLGLAHDTIVVAASDHGEQMGSHGIFQKSHMYEESLRVPMVARAPGLIPAGQRIDAPTSHVDFAPTIAGLCGLGARSASLLEPEGRDLSAWLTGGQPPVPEGRGDSADPGDGCVFSEYTPEGAFEQMTEIRAAIGPRYKYVWNLGDRDELYDTAVDPWELRNGAEDPGLQDVVRALRRRLRGWMRGMGDPLAEEVPDT